MARHLAFAFALVAAALLAGGTGCTSTNSSPSAADGAAMTDSASACIAAGGFCASGDFSCSVGPQDCGFSGGFCCVGNPPDAATTCTEANVKLIQASDYDQSCKVDTDCRQIAVGNACVPCAFGCPLGGAISVSGLAQYRSDIANTPAVGQGCPLIPCETTMFSCCLGGKCQLASQCANATTDASADAGADSAGDDASRGPCTANSDCHAGEQCLYRVGDCSAQGQCLSLASLGGQCAHEVVYCGCGGGPVEGLCGPPYAHGPTSSATEAALGVASPCGHADAGDASPE